MTFPMYTQSTQVGSTLLAARAALVAWTAKPVADMCFRAPPNAPKGVLFAPTINIDCMFDKLKAMEKLSTDLTVDFEVGLWF
jgi:hypothetical protein